MLTAFTLRPLLKTVGVDMSLTATPLTCSGVSSGSLVLHLMSSNVMYFPSAFPGPTRDGAKCQSKLLVLGFDCVPSFSSGESLCRRARVQS